MRKKKKLLLVFFTTIILSLQIFYIIAFAAAPSFYGHYWEVAMAASNAYVQNGSTLPYNKVWNKLDFTSYYNKDVGSFIYTPELTSTPKGITSISGAFDGEAADINNSAGEPVTNCILYQIPIALLTDTNVDIDITFRWFGSPSTVLKYGSTYTGLLPFGSNNDYLSNAVVRIYAYDNIGNYTLIPTQNVFFYDYNVFEVSEPLLNPKFYNDGSYSEYTTGLLEATNNYMYYRDISIKDYETKNLSYLQIYILSTTDEKYYSYPSSYNVSSFRVGSSSIPYFQRLGVIASNFAPDPPVPPTEGELIIESLGQVADIMQNNLDYLSIPNDIQKGIVDTQREELDNIGTELKDISLNINAKDYYVDVDSTDFSDEFMNLYDDDHFWNSAGRIFDASVVKRLFFLMITFGLLSYVVFGKAAG